ncbi:MAG TPA: hypothetical protein VFM35_06185, partial [Candidatus Binatia bacterium]|nr:hypothetical protein [Candidatus Binatia bacterium]
MRKGASPAENLCVMAEILTFAQEIVCPRCQNRFALSQLLNLCGCGSPLLVRYDLPTAKTALAK